MTQTIKSLSDAMDEAAREERATYFAEKEKSSLTGEDFDRWWCLDGGAAFFKRIYELQAQYVAACHAADDQEDEERRARRNAVGR